MEGDITSIKIHKDTLERLKEYKIYPRETYEDIILRFFKTQEQIKKEEN